MRRSRGFTQRALSMTPLIDVIFLLLLFFMLTSTFTRFAEVPLVQAASGETPESEDIQRLFLRLSDAGLSVNGQPVALNPGALAARLEGDEALGLLSVTQEVTSQSLIETLTLLRSVPRLSIAVVQ